VFGCKSMRDAVLADAEAFAFGVAPLAEH
jgi:hypothetical protein